MEVPFPAKMAGLESAVKGLLETFQQDIKQELSELKSRVDEVQASVSALQNSVDRIKAGSLFGVELTRGPTGFGMR